MLDLPSGTVTFLFTDIEGSTRLWERDRAAMAAAVERHLQVLRESVEGHHGVLFKTVGDAVQSVFPFTPPGIGCASVEDRAPCNTSDECGAGEVCAPLDRLGTQPGTNCCVECCGREPANGYRGFCVDVLEPGALCPAVAS